MLLEVALALVFVTPTKVLDVMAAVEEEPDSVVALAELDWKVEDDVTPAFEVVGTVGLEGLPVDTTRNAATKRPPMRATVRTIPTRPPPLLEVELANGNQETRASCLLM